MQRVDSDSPASGRQWPRLLLAGALVLAIAAFVVLRLEGYVSWEVIRENVGGWKRQAEENRFVVLVVFFVVYVAAAALSLPIAGVLSVLGGALFGTWRGTAVVSVAATCGATLAFLSSRYLLRDWVQRRFGRLLGPLNEGVARDGATYLFLMRLTLVIPFWTINLGMGLTAMRPTTFATVSWAGMLLGTFLYVNAGAQLGTELATVESPAGLVSWRLLGSFALLGVVPLVVRLVVRRVWARRW